MAGKVLVAGATGYLGRYVISELKRQGRPFVAVVRNPEKLADLELTEDQVIIRELTKVSQLQELCDGIDVVISCLGITRQQDGMTYHDVDYQANLDLLLEAEKCGVNQFLYVSAYRAQNYPQVRLLAAKERFVKRLMVSNVPHPIVVRPNGYFSDLGAYLEMARSGHAFVMGRGDVSLNPIHGEDLAKFILGALEQKEQEWNVGGPEVLSAKEIAELAFSAVDKPARIHRIPRWVIGAILPILRILPEHLVGPAEFFLTVGREDLVAPKVGHHRLKDHFNAHAKS